MINVLITVICVLTSPYQKTLHQEDKTNTPDCLKKKGYGLCWQLGCDFGRKLFANDTWPRWYAIKHTLLFRISLSEIVWKSIHLKRDGYMTGIHHIKHGTIHPTSKQQASRKQTHISSALAAAECLWSPNSEPHRQTGLGWKCCDSASDSLELPPGNTGICSEELWRSGWENTLLRSQPALLFWQCTCRNLLNGCWI